MVWYSHFFQNFPQLIVIHTVKGFSTVDETEVDVFLEFPSFLYDLANVGNLLNAEFQKIARRDKKAFLSDQCKEIEENNRIGKTRDPLQEN